VAICRPSPFVHFDYFFSNLALYMTVVGIVGLYNNLKITFFIKKKTLFPIAWSTVTQALARRQSAARPDTVYFRTKLWHGNMAQ
jgi:hypothetical protein